MNELIRALCDQKWIDALAQPLQKAIRTTFEAGGSAGAQLKNFLHGRALGHPLHPALIDLPLGSWTLAAILDALEVAGVNKQHHAADTAIRIGLVGAVGAAVAGLTDWSETDERAKRIGLTHGLMNITAAALYALSLPMRSRSRSKGITLSMVAFGLAAGSGFLGGHMTYGEQIGVDHTATADQNDPKEYVDVFAEQDLEESKPAKAIAAGVAIVLVKLKGEIFAMRDACTHLGGPLSEGKVEGDGIRCPWHGSRFCLADGSVLDGPAVFPERTFDVRVVKGRVEVKAKLKIEN